jgi:hypothetical protein
VLETAPSEVASRFPRNCRASQPVSKPWKLPIFSSRAARAPARQSACTCRSHTLEEEDEEEGEDGMDESEDEEDDTADNLWACGDADETPPVGRGLHLCFVPATRDRRAEGGAGWAARARRAQHQPVGWHIGRVRFVGVAAKWRKVCPTANFLVRYTKKETNSAN